MNILCNLWTNGGIRIFDIQSKVCCCMKFFKITLNFNLMNNKKSSWSFCVGYIHENFVLYITPAAELPLPQKISRANLYQNVDTRKYDPKRRNSITFLCWNPKGGFHKNRCFHSVLQSISWVRVARSNCIILPKGNDKYSFPSYE